MAKQLVVRKSFLESYYDNMIEKSTTHKYIRRVPKSSGKGYNYFYPEDFKKPMKALLSFFGMKEDTIDNAYKNNNIQQSYGVTKQNFAQHVLEYLTNRKTWNTFFANKANRDKYKVPEKPETEEKVEVKEKVIEGGKTKKKVSVEVKETKEKNFKSSWNRSLMRKIYSMYNKVPEDNIENKAGIDSIKVGDKVSYNGRVGKVIKDYENGMMFVNFENGGMGRFAVKDLQKMDVTADEVTESTELNAAEQEVNGTNEAIQETVDDVDLNDSHYWDEKRLESEKKIAENYGYEAFKNGITRATANDESFNNYLNKIQDNKDTISTDDAIKGVKSVKHQLMAEWLSGWDRANIENQIGEKDTSALSEAMLGNQNAKKLGAIEEFENGWNFKLQPDTKEKLLEQMSEYTIDALSNTMSEFTRNITDFTMNNLDESIVSMNERITKENLPLLRLYKQVQRDYLIALRDKQKEQPVENETSEKVEYTDGEKAAIALAYRKEKDFDPTLSDYAYYEKIKAKFPQLAEKGELYSTMLEVKDMMFNESKFNAAKEYLNNLINNNNEVENTGATKSNDSLKKLSDIANVLKNGGRVEYQNPVLGKIVFDSGKLGDLSEKNKSGFGIKHLIASRYLKDNMTVDEISALLLKVGEIAETVIPNDPEKTRLNLVKDGIWVGLSKQWNGTEETWIITGFPEEESKGVFTKEASDTITTVIANNSYALENSSIRNQVGAVIASITNNTPDSKNVNTKLLEPKNDALDYYVSGDGMWINKYLRNPEQFAKEGGNVTEEEKQIIAEMDKETTSTVIPEKKLYRAVDASAIFGDISDGDFDDLVAHLVYGNNDRLIANKVGLLINNAENKQITEKGFMSTTKDKDIAENWNGYTGSNKDVVLELDIPEGMTGKDLAAYDIEDDEQKEVLLPRNVDYFIKKVTSTENGKILVQAQVLGQHGNHIAMLGNQNARKYGFSEEDELEYNRQYNWYKDTYVDGTRRNNPYTDEEDTIEGILKDEADERFRVYGDKDIAYIALKDLYIDTTGKDYTPPAKNEPKPETEKQMKKEEKEYVKAREEAGLPKIGINYGDRISAMEDSVSLNPNDVNYAYKDTGYIAGSQKEKIQDFWKRKRETGEGTTIEEIDWTSLEENPRYAEQQITKANILGDIDYKSYKENGMDSRAAYLASRVFAAIPKEPEGHDITARKNYVIAVNTVKDRLSQCKTIAEVKEFVDDVYGEYKQTFDSQILRVPEVNQAKAVRDEVLRERERIRTEVMEWCRNELIPKYKTLGKKERKAVWRYRNEIKKEVINKIKEYDPEFGKDDIYIEIDTSNMWWPVSVGSDGLLDARFRETNDKLRAARAKAKDEIMKDNVTYDTWKELGKFAELRYSKSFQTHYNNLKAYDEKYRTDDKGIKSETYAYKYRDKTYDKYEDWEWLDASKNKIARKESEVIKGKKKRTFEMIVPKTLERKGGRDISVKSTAELKKAFNLRDVQTGSYVQSDPISAKWHVDNLAAGFADLADVLGISDDQVSLNGRLALAIGARGHGGALAHYEPVERVINITKFRGGGSLGHEWFHSFDNMIAEAITGGNVSVYMSDPNQQSKTVKLMDAFKPNAYHDEIPADELSQNVRNKFINLVNAMMTGDTPETEVVLYDKEDVDTAKNFFEKQIPNYRGLYWDRDGFYQKLSDAKNLDEAITAINDKFRTTVMMIRENRDKVGKLGKYEQKRMKDTVKTYEKYRVMAAAYFDSKDDKTDGGEVTVKTGRTVSRFYEDAKKLDEGKQKSYWSTPLEMAARAFEAYLVDKLKEKGQRNDYLSGHASNDVYDGAWYPYPTERDRVKINKAFDELFEVIRNENAIRKAIDILDKPDFIIKGGRFLIRK